MKKIRGLRFPVIPGVASMSQYVHAADSLTFKGKLIIPACIIQNTEASWGDIEIQSLVQGDGNQKDFTAGMNYPYSLGTVKITIILSGQTGNSILIPNTSITSGGGLFIYLYGSNNSGIGSAVTLGSQFTPRRITGTAPVRKITLYARLGYKGNMQSSRVGTFPATATLAASYP